MVRDLSRAQLRGLDDRTLKLSAARASAKGFNAPQTEPGVAASLEGRPRLALQPRCNPDKVSPFGVGEGVARNPRR